MQQSSNKLKIGKWNISTISTIFTPQIKKDKRKAVGVDIALVNGMTYDNHVTMLSNKK
ncbi:hypothetical protein ACT7DP_31450 [Bacillus paranthracis]